ncbi:hypothetical protein QVG61_12650 [Thiohalobacter sp. IOR34]|uniref:hypothetical protein n=1 Tax=Thiohalobacter sp. IOR34 TaxID=3057176 RepID=UPI0025B1211F|nr:hypothetical protein [Thiohalobacter sp. IOR34]WJW75322.1 hypothetical protein QVG61_12650 [Thiohalobacter sp. IOR34]
MTLRQVGGAANPHSAKLFIAMGQAMVMAGQHIDRIEVFMHCRSFGLRPLPWRSKR